MVNRARIVPNLVYHTLMTPASQQQDDVEECRRLLRADIERTFCLDPIKGER